MSRTIQESVRILAGTHLKDQMYLFDCEVVSVDQDSRTCEVKTLGGDSEMELINVRLMSTVDDGILVLPVVGSQIIVCYSKRVLPFVMQFSEVDQIVFNGGAYDGLVKIIDPDDSNAGLLKKLNNLENKVNTIINTFNSHVHSGVTTGGGSSGVSATPVNGTLTPTVQADIEDDKITH